MTDLLWEKKLVGFVGGGCEKNKYGFKKDELRIWNDNSKEIVNMIKLSEAIISVKLRENLIFIGIQNAIFVYKDIKIYDTLSVFNKWQGIFSISVFSTIPVISWPQINCGRVSVKFYYPSKSEQKISNFMVCKTEIVCLALNNNGDMLAVASKCGTVIRIYNTKNETLIQELRRGSKNCNIHQITFHKSSQFLLCTSDTESIHMFKIKYVSNDLIEEKLNINSENEKSSYFYRNYEKKID